MGMLLMVFGQVLIANKMAYAGLPTLIVGVIVVVFGFAIAAVQGTATLTGPCPCCSREVTGSFPAFTCPHCEGRVIVLKNNMFYSDEDVCQDDIPISKRKDREMMER